MVRLKKRDINLSNVLVIGIQTGYSSEKDQSHYCRVVQVIINRNDNITKVNIVSMCFILVFPFTAVY